MLKQEGLDGWLLTLGMPWAVRQVCFQLQSGSSVCAHSRQHVTGGASVLCEGHRHHQAVWDHSPHRNREPAGVLGQSIPGGAPHVTGAVPLGDLCTCLGRPSSMNRTIWQGTWHAPWTAAIAGEFV